MVDIFENVGARTIVTRGIIPLLVDAGACEIIQEKLDGSAIDERSLLLAVKKELGSGYPVLAAALNFDTLEVLVTYMESAGMGASTVDGLPTLLNEDGPVSVTAERNGGDPTQIDITYNSPPPTYEAEIYRDNRLAKTSDDNGSGGTVSETLTGVEDDEEEHTIRVLYINADGDQTRFGPVAEFE